MLFGHGGAELLAQEMNLPFLGAIPIHMELRVNSDEGTPLRNWENAALAEELDRVAKNVAAQISITAMSGEYVQPSLSIT